MAIPFLIPIDMNGLAIQNVADPTNAQDVATKAYVDANAGGAAVASAHIYQSAGGDSIPTNSTEVLALSTALYSQGLTLDLSDPHGITIDHAGVYSLNLCIAWGSGSAGVHMVFLYLNGSLLVRSHLAPEPSGTSRSMYNFLLGFDENDTIQMRVYQNSGGSRTIYGGDYTTFLSIARVADMP